MEDLTPVLTYSCSQLSGPHHTPYLAPPLCELIKKPRRALLSRWGESSNYVNPAPILPLTTINPQSQRPCPTPLNHSWTCAHRPLPRKPHYVSWELSQAFLLSGGFQSQYPNQILGKEFISLCEVITTSINFTDEKLCPGEIKLLTKGHKARH